MNLLMYFIVQFMMKAQNSLFHDSSGLPQYFSPCLSGRTFCLKKKIKYVKLPSVATHCQKGAAKSSFFKF